MRAVVQRVSQARVEVGGAIAGQIEKGLVVFLAIEAADQASDADYLARKISGMRIFADEDGRMNRSVTDVSGSILIISQFTLYGDIRRGTRPSFDRAARPEYARELYSYFVSAMEALGIPVQTGVFQAHMFVHVINDGPVTILCESVRISATE